MKVNRGVHLICPRRRQDDSNPTFNNPAGAWFNRVESGSSLIFLIEHDPLGKSLSTPALARLGVEKLENLARAFGTDPGNLAEIGDRGPLDLLQRSEMMQQGTFA